MAEAFCRINFIQNERQSRNIHRRHCNVQSQTCLSRQLDVQLRQMAFALDGYAQNNRLIDHALRLVGHLAHSITRHSSTFSPYGSTFQADRKRDLARLDEESADLALLQTNLDKMAGLTDKMVCNVTFKKYVLMFFHSERLNASQP